MRKIIPIFIVGFLVLSGLGAIAFPEDEIEQSEVIKITFSKPKIIEKEEYLSVELDEASSNSIAIGMPSIPLVSKVFTFPIGTQLNDVEVTFSEEIIQSITKPVIPAPEPQIISTLHSIKPIKKSDPIETYSDIDIYPNSKYTYRTGAGIKDGKHVIYLTVFLHPIQYEPSSNLIYYTENAEVNINYNPSVKPVNYPDEYDLLVIAPTIFADEFSKEYQIPNSNQVVSFVDYKNAHDILTQVVTLDEIYNSEYFQVQGKDDQEKIKYFIKNAIENWGITYVILVGAGVEGEEIFPVRQAWIGSGKYEEYFPSDLYYADIYNSEMQFSDWDEDDDEKYAEYINPKTNDMSSVDMYPDVYLGKLPCVNEREVENVIKKILYYDIHNKMTNKIIQVGGDTFPGDHESINEGEYANEAVFDLLSGYSTTQLWASNGGLTKQKIADGFKSNVDFVDFSGHGSWASWGTHPTEDDEVWLPPETLISPYTGFLYIDFDMYLVNNKYKFPAVVYNACSCNKYSEDPNCIGWATVKRPNGGGIVSFGASGIGYGGQGKGEIERVWGWMEVKLFDELHNTKLLGEVWANAITDYANSFELDDGDYKTILEMSMFADPTVSIENGDDPKISSKNRPLINSILEIIADYFPRLERLIKWFI